MWHLLQQPHTVTVSNSRHVGQDPLVRPAQLTNPPDQPTDGRWNTDLPRVTIELGGAQLTSRTTAYASMPWWYCTYSPSTPWNVYTKSRINTASETSYETSCSYVSQYLQHTHFRTICVDRSAKLISGLLCHQTPLFVKFLSYP